MRQRLMSDTGKRIALIPRNRGTPAVCVAVLVTVNEVLILLPAVILAWARLKLQVIAKAVR
jgi:hypothetical protein